MSKQVPQFTRAILSAVVAVTLLVFAQAPVSAASANPSILNYQARVTNTAGTPLTGAVDIKISIYDAASGGTCLYTLRGTCGTPATFSATATNGVFSVLLGDTVMNALSGDLFDADELYLGLTIEADAEMTPRKRFASAPYAFNADRLDDLDTSSTGGTSAYVPSTSSSGLLTVTGDPTSSNAVITANPAAAQIATNDLLFALRNDGSDRFTVDAEGDAVANGSLKLRDLTASPSNNIFEIANSIDAVRYLTVSSTSTSVAGQINVDSSNTFFDLKISGTSRMTVSANSINSTIAGAGGNNVALAAGGNTLMVVYADGKVGIGTGTAAESRLTVRDASASPTGLIFNVSNANRSVDYLTVSSTGTIVTDLTVTGTCTGCGGGSTTLQEAYDNSTSPELTLDVTRKALTIRDAVSTVGNLLEISNNIDSARHLTVSSTATEFFSPNGTFIGRISEYASNDGFVLRGNNNSFISIDGNVSGFHFNASGNDEAYFTADAFYPFTDATGLTLGNVTNRWGTFYGTDAILRASSETPNTVFTVENNGGSAKYLTVSSTATLVNPFGSGGSLGIGTTVGTATLGTHGANLAINTGANDASIELRTDGTTRAKLGISKNNDAPIVGMTNLDFGIRAQRIHLSADAGASTGLFVQNSTNNVGIGTTSAPARLSVRDAAVSPTTNIFQVANFIDSVRYLTVSSTSTSLGGSLVLQNVAGDGVSTNGSMVYNTSTNKFRCYENGAWTDCVSSGGSTTLQAAYDASTSPELTLDATRGALSIRNASTALGNLIEISNNNDSTRFLSVSSTSTLINPSKVAGYKLGINTDNPATDLEVYSPTGGAAAQLRVTAEGNGESNIMASQTGGANILHMSTFGPSVGGTLFGITKNRMGFFGDRGSSQMDHLVFGATFAANLVFGTSNEEKARIASNGTLLVGPSYARNLTVSSTSTSLGGSLILQNVAGDGISTNGSMVYNTSTNKFRCYENGAWTDCVSSGGSGTLQQAYDNSTSPELTLDATRGALTIRDASTALGNLLEIQNSNNALSYLTVSSTATIVGTDILPTANDTHDLGSSSLRFADLYLGPSTLHIGSDGDESAITYTTASDLLTFQNSADSATGFQFLDADGGAPILNVDTSNERVGIGTAAPAAKFSVIDSTSINGEFRFSSSAVATFGGTNLDLLYDIGAGAVQSARIRNAVTDGGVGTQTSTIEFQTLVAGTLAERMRINDTGNVGIGDASPASLFTVGSGDLFQVNSSGNVSTVGNLSFNGSGTFGDASGDSVTWNAGTLTVANDLAVTLSGGVNGINFDANTLSIDAANDRVGIGTAAPAAKLSVIDSTSINGEFRFSSSAVETFGGTNLDLLYDIGAGAVQSARIRNAVTNGGVGTQTSTIEFQTLVAGTLAERMRINSDGNVGIGDSSPASLFTVGSGDLFQVNSSGNLVKIRNVTYSWPSSQGGASTVLTNDGSGNLSWGAGGGSTTLQNAYDNDVNGGDVTITTNATDGKLIIAGDQDFIYSGSGGVGIGASAATNKLHLEKSNANTVSSSTFWDFDFGGGLTIRNANDTANTTAGIGFKLGSANTAVAGLAAIQESTTLGALGFFTGGSGTSSSAPERMRISSGGNLTVDTTTFFVDAASDEVGIGTITPDARLEIEGSFSSSADVFRITDSSASGSFIKLGDSTSVAGNFTPFMQTKAVGTGAFRIGFQLNAEPGEDGADDAAIALDGRLNGGALTTAPILTVNNNGTELVRVGANGNLGVGDPSPASLFTVGSGDLFQVNSSGDLVKIRNVTYSWPSSQGGASTVLTNDGSGNLTWGAAGGSTTLQDAYDNSTSPELTLDATRKALTIRDAATALGNLIELSNNNDSTRYFSASSTSTRVADLLRVGSGDTTPVGGTGLVVQQAGGFSHINLISGAGNAAAVYLGDTSSVSASYINYNSSSNRFEQGNPAGIMMASDGSTGTTFNPNNGSLFDFRVEGDVDDDLIFADADNNLVGIGSDAPTGKLTVATTNETGPASIGTFDARHFVVGAPGNGFAVSYGTGTTIGATLTSLNATGGVFNLMAFQAANYSFKLGGAEKVAIDTNGTLKVIGTASPTTNLLQIQNSTDTDRYLTVSSTNTAIGSASNTHTISPNAWIAGNLVPSADDTYSLGEYNRRWKDLWVTGGSVHIANDTSQTDQFTIGYSGSTALLAANGTTPVQIKNGANAGLTIDASGNITLAGDLTISGSCTGCGGGSELTDPTVTGNLLPTTSASTTPVARTISNVDTADAVGTYSSVAVGTDGLPVIAYYDTTNTALKVVKCGNATCASGNTITTVDTTDDVGKGASIAIGQDGFPIISYYDDTADDLKAVKCGNASCSSGNTTTVIDDGNVSQAVSSNTSVVIGRDGLPLIAYTGVSGGSFRLLVVKCGNDACSSGNSIQSVGNGNSSGYKPSMAIGQDGLPVISYLGGNEAGLYVAKCADASCSSGTTNSTVDTAGATSTGRWTSIAIAADGAPIIAYGLTGSSAVKVAKCSNATCSIATAYTIDSGTTAHNAAIAVPPDGQPVVAYYNSALDLVVAKCDSDCAGGTSTTKTTIDSTNDVGTYTSVAITPDGLPFISYHYATGADLRTVKCSDMSCRGTSNFAYTAGSDIGSPTKHFNNVYATAFWGKEFQISGFDLAESYRVDDQTIAAGDIVRIAPSSTDARPTVEKSRGAYGDGLVGIISTKPGIKLTDWTSSPDGRLVALAGRVPTRVSTENGPIAPGDPITSSSVPGVGMRATRAGSIVGYALSSWIGSGEGLIEVYVSPGWTSGSTTGSATSTLTVSGEPHQDFGGMTLTNIGGIVSTSGLWSISDDGHLIVTHVDAEEVRAARFGVKNSEADKTAGKSRIFAGQTERVIENPLVTTDTLVVATFEGNPGSHWWIGEKASGKFTVHLSVPATADVPFTWWIVGTDSLVEQEELAPEPPEQSPPAPSSPEEGVSGPSTSSEGEDGRGLTEMVAETEPEPEQSPPAPSSPEEVEETVPPVTVDEENQDPAVDDDTDDPLTPAEA